MAKAWWTRDREREEEEEEGSITGEVNGERVVGGIDRPRRCSIRAGSITVSLLEKTRTSGEASASISNERNIGWIKKEGSITASLQ